MAVRVIWIAHIDMVFFYWTEMHVISIVSLATISTIDFMCRVCSALEWWRWCERRLVAASSVEMGVLSSGRRWNCKGIFLVLSSLLQGCDPIHEGFSQKILSFLSTSLYEYFIGI